MNSALVFYSSQDAIFTHSKPLHGNWDFSRIESWVAPGCKLHVGSIYAICNESADWTEDTNKSWTGLVKSLDCLLRLILNLRLRGYSLNCKILISFKIRFESIRFYSIY